MLNDKKIALDTYRFRLGRHTYVVIARVRRDIRRRPTNQSCPVITFFQSKFSHCGHWLPARRNDPKVSASDDPT